LTSVLIPFAGYKSKYSFEKDYVRFSGGNTDTEIIAQTLRQYQEFFLEPGGQVDLDRSIDL